MIAPELGGWQALVELRERAHQFGVQLASDMVPNHTGMDSRWVAEHPDYFYNAVIYLMTITLRARI